MTQAEQGKRCCVFCGGSPVTQEHVWPKWLRESAHAHLPGQNVGWEIEQFGKTRHVPVLEAVVNRVCGKCYNGWLSDLENEAKPLLLPLMYGYNERAKIAQDAQLVLATWAVKTVLLADFFGKRRSFAPRVYEEFFRDPRPPKRCMVWMAAHRGSKVRLRSYIGKTTVETEKRYNTVGVLEHNPVTAEAGLGTLGVFFLVFQVLIHEGNHVPPGPPAKRAWSGVIWPPADPFVDFPPEAGALDDSGFLVFAHRRGTLRQVPAKPDDPPVF